MGERIMTDIEAYRWLTQPGIQAILFHYDRDTNEALKRAIKALLKPQNKLVTPDTEIKVLIDEGGIFQGLYVSPELKPCNVELIDFVTEDPDEIEDTTQRYNTTVERACNGELVNIF